MSNGKGDTPRPMIITDSTDPAQVDAIVPNLTRADQWFLVLGITDYEWDALGAPVDEEC